VAVEKGESVYCAGIFAAADSDMRTIEELQGTSVAFGDVNPTSSFTFQVAMMLDAGLDPAREMSRSPFPRASSA
jgi:phosphonate transport system substrate-binding protein